MRVRWLDLIAVTGLRIGLALATPLLVVCGRTWQGRAVGILGAAVACAAGGYDFALQAASWGNLFPLPDGGPRRPPPLFPEWVFVVGFLSGLLVMVASAVWFFAASVYLLATLPAYHSGARPVLSLFLGPTWLHRWQMALPPKRTRCGWPRGWSARAIGGSRGPVPGG